MKKIKEKLHLILISIGIILAIIINAYVKKNNILAFNNLTGYVLLLITWVPLFSGLWLYANKIQKYKQGLSLIIRFIIALGVTSYILSGTMFLLRSLAQN